MQRSAFSEQQTLVLCFTFSSINPSGHRKTCVDSLVFADYAAPFELKTASVEVCFGSCTINLALRLQSKFTPV